ncbi:TetR/AcrR family transcriptional regulator [Escherichia coli]|nr:TetR/AcrR family transcriptional regulator [Escherichia coli]
MKTGKVELKRRVRRNEIIAAARKCFEERGLHGTTMAYVAEHAHLSVGQVYRVFESKEEIIEVIITDVINAKIEAMIEDNHNLKQKARALAGIVTSPVNKYRDDLLLMEITAESKRNPRLLAILKMADNRLKEEDGRLIRNKHPNFSESKINVISEFIAVLTEGTLYRKGIQEDFAHKTEMNEFYEQMFSFIFDS